MGVTLIDRSGRPVRLTAAGEVLLRDGRAALEAVAAATRRAQRAGLGGPRLVLAMKPGMDGGLLPVILTDFEAQPEALPVEIVFSIGGRAAMLRDGRADVALLHSPQNDLTGLDAEKLFTEPQVVVLPEGHRLAQLPVVCLADLAGETMPRWPGKPGGHADGLVVSDAGQLMQLIALGRMVAVVGESVRGRLHSGLLCRPVADAPAATVVIAWPRSSTSRHVAAFVRAAAAAAQRRVVTPNLVKSAAAG